MYLFIHAFSDRTNSHLGLLLFWNHSNMLSFYFEIPLTHLDLNDWNEWGLVWRVQLPLRSLSIITPMSSVLTLTCRTRIRGVHASSSPAPHTSPCWSQSSDELTDLTLTSQTFTSVSEERNIFGSTQNPAPVQWWPVRYNRACPTSF